MCKDIKQFNNHQLQKRKHRLIKLIYKQQKHQIHIKFFFLDNFIKIQNTQTPNNQSYKINKQKTLILLKTYLTIILLFKKVFIALPKHLLVNSVTSTKTDKFTILIL